MSKVHSWSKYYASVSSNPPSKNLVDALAYVKNKYNALELGAGTPTNSILLLENGFHVTALDKELEAETFFDNLKQNPKFEFVLRSMEDFEYKENTYDLVSAQRALPFLENKNVLVEVVNKIKNSLTRSGIFVGNFFGPNDTWSKEGKEMAFVNKEEIEEMFSDMEIIKLKEKEEDSQTAAGTPHYWHVFQVIVRKK